MCFYLSHLGVIGVSLCEKIGGTHERVKRSWLARHDERPRMLTFVIILLASIESCEKDRPLIQLDGFCLSVSIVPMSAGARRYLHCSAEFLAFDE